MEKRTLETAIFLLAFALVIVIVGQPLAEQRITTNSFIIGGDAEIEEPVILTEDLVGEFWSPTVWDDDIVYGAWYNWTDAELGISDAYQLTWSPAIVEDYPELYQDQLVYIQTDFSIYDIFVKNLTTNWTSQITFTPEMEIAPDIWGENIVFSRHNSTTGWDVYSVNRHTGIETCISNETGSQYRPQIYEDTLVFIDDQPADNYLCVVDLNEPETIDYVASGLDTSRISIWGDYIGYSGYREGYHIPMLYNLENNVEYELMPREDTVEGHTAIVWDELVVFNINEDGNTDIAIMTLETALFDEQYIKITNDTYVEWITDFHNNTIVYDFIGDDGYYDVGYIDIVEVSSSEIERDIEQGEIVYNLDWIYFTIIMLVGLSALTFTYYTKYMKQ